VKKTDEGWKLKYKTGEVTEKKNCDSRTAKEEYLKFATFSFGATASVMPGGVVLITSTNFVVSTIVLCGQRIGRFCDINNFEGFLEHDTCISSLSECGHLEEDAAEGVFQLYKPLVGFLGRVRLEGDDNLSGFLEYSLTDREKALLLLLGGCKRDPTTTTEAPALETENLSQQLKEGKENDMLVTVFLL